MSLVASTSPYEPFLLVVCVYYNTVEYSIVDEDELMSNDTDVIVVGAGLAGLVAAAELVDAGRRVILLDQEPEASLGGQAFWSFGGLFLVDTAEQRRLRVRDSRELAWLHGLGVRWFPLVQWAERGGYLATGHGNSVPRFHLTWGTGPGVLEPFVRRVRQAPTVQLRFRHRVTGLTSSGGTIDGVTGEVLMPSDTGRGAPSN